MARRRHFVGTIMQTPPKTFGHIQRPRIAALWIVTLFLIAFALLFQSAWKLYPPGGVDLQLTIRIAGIGLIGTAILGRLWCTLYIGGRKSVVLVDDGPYSVCRNPLYLFSIIGAAGVGAQTGSAAPALLCAIVVHAILLRTVTREEQLLRTHFGQAYVDYCRRVPAFCVDCRLFTDREMIEITPKRLYGTLIDSLVFLAAVPAMFLVEYLQDEGYLPVFFSLY
ncbi:hypothetical protein MAUB1S_07799 [Mycolicibacterium aubagnense]